ncbi:MAG: 23S rRNA (adenine(2030)-N(6))-methyltransferase RlmJ, partial [Gammaproteobacteria bacterium]
AYFRIIGRFNPDRALRFYPGSPKFAEALLRKQDRGWLFELHPSDFAILRHNFAGNRSFIVRKEDGYRTLTALLPPKSRRGIVLIDPPYELKSDYATAVETLIKAHRRFPTGVYALWYPVVERRRIDKMEEVLAASGTKRIQLFELGRSPDAPGPGMTAAGMIVINPPWTLFQKMEDILPRLATAMRAGERSHFRCITLAGE